MQSRCHTRPVQARRLFLFIVIIFYNRKITFSAQIATWAPSVPAISQIPSQNRPLHLSGLGEVPSKMVCGHNLCYMAPFNFSRAGFCMFFWLASFVCSCPGADSRAQDQILGHGVNIVARGPFGIKNGSKKNHHGIIL